MSRKDYIPRNDALFLVWATKMMETADERCLDWKIAPPSDIIGNKVTVFKTKLARAQDVNHGKVDVLEKNEARKDAEKACRTYVQGFLARNPIITNADREYMGLTVYDIIPTTVNDPVGLATATVKYPNKGALELNIKHVDSTPTDAKANYGFRIYFGVYGVDETTPVSGKFLRESRFTRQKKMLFTFEPEDSGKTACFSIRYENSKGKAGQWGELITAIIP